MRIQFEMEDDEYRRFLAHIPGDKSRHVFAHKAAKEWINRQEARDRSRLDEQKRQRARQIQECIDEGLVSLSRAIARERDD